MSRIIKPIVSPGGHILVVSGAALWLVAALLLSAAPGGATAAENAGQEIPLAQFEEVEGVPGVLYQPRVSTSLDGTLYVVDDGNQRVLRLISAPGHKYNRAAAVYGSKGTGPGELLKPRSVAADVEGNVFVADVRGNRISKYMADGTYLTSVNLPIVSAVLVDPEGRVLAYPGRGTALITRFSNDLTSEESFLEKGTRHRSPQGAFIAIDAAGRLYFLDQESLQVKVFDRDFNQINEWPVDHPGFRELVAQERAAFAARMEARGARGSASVVSSMAVDPQGERLVLTYLVSGPDREKITHVSLYSADGVFQWTEVRDKRISTASPLADGTWAEGDMEAISVWGPQSAGTSEN